jgi:glycosyltransferase involved in cell wall biosynthesis
MRVLVVTPTYNERENLEALATAVLRAPVGADYLIVDDASPDGTGTLADQIAAREPRFKVMHRPGSWASAPPIDRPSPAPSRKGTTPSSRWTATGRTTRGISLRWSKARNAPIW